MAQLATITSKRQFTIPAVIFQDLGLEEGEKVVVSKENKKIVIQSAKDLVQELAGSAAMPEKFKDLPLEKITKLAKKEYLTSKK